MPSLLPQWAILIPSIMKFYPFSKLTEIQGFLVATKIMSPYSSFGCNFKPSFLIIKFSWYIPFAIFILLPGVEASIAS